MDEGVDQETFRWLKWCREYLHAATLADIVSADGTAILETAWLGIPTSHKRDRYEWPRSVSPSRRHWKKWQTILNEAVVCSGDPEDRTLLNPLGAWYDDLSLWNWVYSPSRNRVFQRLGHGWIKHPSLPSNPDLHVQKTFNKF